MKFKTSPTSTAASSGFLFFMEENQSPQGNGFLPPDRIKGFIALMLTKKFGNYQQAIDALRNLYVGRDNFEKAQDTIKSVNSFLNAIEEHRKQEKEPFLEQGRTIDKVHKEFAEPIAKERDVIQGKLNVIGKEIEREKQLEQQRINERKQRIDAMNNFILDYSLKIASATTNEQLLGYERLINLEKANKSKYADQLPLLIEHCNELNAKLKEQKDLIKERDRIEEEKKKAEKAGDDEKLNELQQKEQEIQDKIYEKTVEVQETASNNAISSDIVSQDDTAGAKARRTTWKAEIQDENIAIKKAKDMLRIELDPEKVRNSINTLKAAGVFSGKEEVVINGIRYFQEKTF